MTAYKRSLATSVFVLALLTPGLRGDSSATAVQPEGVVAGSIVDEALEPLADVKVTLDQAGRTIATVRTDKDGAFRFKAIKLGTYELKATKAGLSNIQKTVPVTRAGATVQMGLAMLRDGTDRMTFGLPPSTNPWAVINQPRQQAARPNVIVRPTAREEKPAVTLPNRPRSIYGFVTDASGGALPGVTVTVEGPTLSTPVATVVVATGYYEIGGLPNGTFSVHYELAGFRKVVRANIVLRGDSGLRIDMKLEVGALTEELTVTSAAPVVNTQQTNTGGSASGRQPWAISGGSITNLSSNSSSLQGNFDSFDQIRTRRHETARYAHVEPNRFNLTTTEPMSTFGADVDTASFTNVRRFLNEGRLPPVDAVRVEEFVNYFKFDYDAPSAGRAVGITSEVGACPWAPEHKLVLVGARAQASDATAPRNLVFLVDVSGSMAPPERLPLIKTALGMMVDTLRPTDEVSIVTYAGYTGVALHPTTARHRDRILDAINSLGSGGSTNGGAGLMLAYRLARQQFAPGGINRVILATDGDFNVGITGQRDLYQLIDREKQSGVFLSVLGVGDNNLQDRTMEMLADKGNGNYAYLDSLQEARRVLIRESSSTLETVAKDVKFQVEFNPATVKAWKLIGYENRLMAHEEFNDDKKDGGELGAGHSVTVLYEVVPAGVPVPGELEPNGRPSVEPLVYQARRETIASKRDDLLTVRVRYKLPDESNSVMFTSAVKPGGQDSYLSFASAVAEFGLLLRDSDTEVTRWNGLVSRAQQLASAADPSGERAGFARMVELAAGLRRIK